MGGFLGCVIFAIPLILQAKGSDISLSAAAAIIFPLAIFAIAFYFRKGLGDILRIQKLTVGREIVLNEGSIQISGHTVRGPLRKSLFRMQDPWAVDYLHADGYVHLKWPEIVSVQTKILSEGDTGDTPVIAFVTQKEEFYIPKKFLAEQDVQMILEVASEQVRKQKGT